VIWAMEIHWLQVSLWGCNEVTSQWSSSTPSLLRSSAIWCLSQNCE
jgi:hypothetical protein